MTTQLQQYTNDALRTESVTNPLFCDPDELTAVLTAIQASTELADMLKKLYWYGRSVDAQKWRDQVTLLNGATSQLTYFASLNRIGSQHAQYLGNTRVLHASIGIATEAGELVQQVMAGGQDLVNLAEEGGDVSWYLAVLFDAVGVDWGDKLETNIAKLKQRYPDKFSAERALNRDLTAERQILES
jgi:hypothetical protein